MNRHILITQLLIGVFMEIEIELKLFVHPDFSSLLRDKISGLTLLKHQQKNLINVYYDTADFLLRENQIGLRIRQYDDVFVQTLKTAGRVVAGLSHRPEYNATLIDLTPDLFLIPQDAWPKNFDISQLNKQLSPLFSTDFHREQWLVCMEEGALIEVAFDIGQVSTSLLGSHQDPIYEIELESKSGQIDALFNLAAQLAKVGGVRLGNLSKAARGYRLATKYQGDPIKSLTMVPINAQMNTEQAFVKTIEHALAHWHYHEQIYVERACFHALLEITHALALIRQAFVIYGGLIPRRASAFLRQELHWLENELIWVQKANNIERLCQDKGYFLRKLHAQKQLRHKLEEEYQQFPSSENVLQLLYSSRYCTLLLDINRWLLNQDWHVYLDDKMQAKLAEPIARFAHRSLTHYWHELLKVFSLENEMGRIAYLDQQPRLFRNLLTGCSFASLYDVEQRETFRLPWLDILQGIDDFLLLEPLRGQLTAQDIEQEDKDQIKKWLNRKEESLLHAMAQSRQIGVTLDPYWHK